MPQKKQESCIENFLTRHPPIKKSTAKNPRWCYWENADVIQGYMLRKIKVGDDEVLRISEKSLYPILIPATPGIN